MRESANIRSIRPSIIRCEWGPWLAASEHGAAVSVAVLGASESEARMAFDGLINHIAMMLSHDDEDGLGS